MVKVQENRTIKDYVLLVLKGIAMGAANKIPGVSGGIVAFVAGFYEELIYSLHQLNGKALKLLVFGRFKSFWKYINGTFLLLLFSGTIFSYFSVSLLLDYWLKQNETNVWAAFFGMILASLFYILNQVSRWNKATVSFAFLGLLTGLLISVVKPVEANDSLLFVFICGVISVSGMTLPGLSGSFLLLVIGNYNLLLIDSVNNLYTILEAIIRGDFEFLNHAEQMQLLYILICFTTGSIVGLILFSNVINFLLHKYHQISIATIIGFIAGSMRIVWPWKKAVYKLTDSGTVVRKADGTPDIQNYSYFLPDLSIGSNWVTVLFVLLGIAAIILLEYYGNRTKQ